MLYLLAVKTRGSNLAIGEKAALMISQMSGMGESQLNVNLIQHAATYDVTPSAVWAERHRMIG
jgi:hypothetical protein